VKGIFAEMIAFLFLAIVIVVVFIILPLYFWIRGGLEITYAIDVPIANEAKLSAPYATSSIASSLPLCNEGDYFYEGCDRRYTCRASLLQQLVYVAAGDRLDDLERRVRNVLGKTLPFYWIWLRDLRLEKGTLAEELYVYTKLPIFTFGGRVEYLEVYS